MKKKHIVGVILILIGVVWIVHETGALKINWAASLKTLWPIFLVATGATIIFIQKKKLVTGIWILTFVLLVGFGIYKRNESNRFIDLDSKFHQEHYSIDSVKKKPVEKEIPLVAGTEKAMLILQLGAVKVDLSEGRKNLLVHLDSDIPMLRQRLTEGKQTVLEYSHSNNNRKAIPHFDLEMNPDLIWTLDANLGIVDGKLSFKEIPVEQIDLNLAAGDLDLVIGRRQKDTNLVLRAGAANLDIYIPKNAGLKVKSGKLMADLSFHNIPMAERDNYYISENYDTAEQKIAIDIKTAMSKIKVFADVKQ
jgi:hypothetical protein